MLPASMGSSCRDPAEVVGAPQPQGSTEKEPEEDSGVSQPATATAFICGYTDLRNEGRAPNVLFCSVSHNALNAPSPTIAFLFLPVT